MSGYLPADAKVFLLSQLASKGAYVGLANAVPSGLDVTLANITEVTTPGYARAAVTWGVPGASDLNVGPVEVANSQDVNFPAVTEDLVPAAYAFLTDKATGNALAAPVASLGAATNSGGTFTAGTYYWVVTAVNAKGETIASNEVSATLSANGSQVINWAVITGATGYNIYRGTVSGQENVLVGTLNGNTFTDTGAVGTAATPPSVNSAAIGTVYFVWQLAEPVTALAGKPIKAPANGLVIE